MHAPSDNPFTGASRHFLERELLTLRGVEQAHAGYAAALAAAREATVYRASQRALDDLLAGLADLRSDHIVPTLRDVEEALEDLERPGERRAAIAAGPRVL